MPLRSSWRSTVTNLCEVLDVLESRRAVSLLPYHRPKRWRAILGRDVKGRRYGRPKGSVSERQEFFTKVVASFIDDAAQQERIRPYSAALRLAEFIVKVPPSALSGEVRGSLSIPSRDANKTDIERFARRLLEYRDYDRKHPLTT